MSPLSWRLQNSLSEMDRSSWQKSSKDTVELNPVNQLDIIDTKDYLIQQQQNSHFSQVHMDYF